MIEDFQNATPEQVVIVAIIFAAWGLLAWKKRTPHIEAPTDTLDTPIMQWAPSCFLTVRQLLANILCFGITGSGKTSGPGKNLLRACVRYPGSGGLILASKPEDAGSARAIFEAEGRRDDLLMVNPDGELCCNICDFFLSIGADATELARGIITVAETTQASESRGGGEMGDFWARENERLIYNSIVVLLLARGKITPTDIQKFIMTALQNPQQVSSAEWQGCFHDKCMRAAFDAPKKKIQQHDFDGCVAYFFKEWPSMADKTRSSILTGVRGILHCMDIGLARKLTAAETNVSPAEMLHGKWIMINLPPAQYGDTGVFVNSVWRYATQKLILRRKATANDPPVIIFCDEFQQVVNSHDAAFLAQCRSHGGCQIMLTQTTNSLFGSMRGDTGRNQAIALMSNAAHKVFCAVDPETAEYASKLLGREERVKTGGSIAPEEDIWQSMFGPPKITTSFNTQWEPTVEPGVFMSGMRVGGPQNNYCVDAIVIKTGDQFPGGGNWRFCTFDQRS